MPDQQQLPAVEVTWAPDGQRCNCPRCNRDKAEHGLEYRRAESVTTDGVTRHPWDSDGCVRPMFSIHADNTRCAPWTFHPDAEVDMATFMRTGEVELRIRKARR